MVQLGLFFTTGLIATEATVIQKPIFHVHRIRCQPFRSSIVRCSCRKGNPTLRPHQDRTSTQHPFVSFRALIQSAIYALAAMMLDRLLSDRPNQHSLDCGMLSDYDTRHPRLIPIGLKTKNKTSMEVGV
ncbi:hypothetical protein EDD17DRAFT_1614917 [Pisolithus thermaeus]|nr:hypothetical protein EDD17DRAFT_1614917 [Pisolithus thermaeus]